MSGLLILYTTDISVTCWILNKNKKSRVGKRPGGDVTFRDRTNEVLFMDLRQKGHPYEKKYIEFTDEDRAEIVDRFKSWRFEGYPTKYEDVPEFCYSAKKDEIIEKDYSLVPSRYIEFLYNQAGNVDYAAEMTRLQSELKNLMVEEEKSRLALQKVLEGLGYAIN